MVGIGNSEVQQEVLEIGSCRVSNTVGHTRLPDFLSGLSLIKTCLYSCVGDSRLIIDVSDDKGSSSYSKSSLNMLGRNVNTHTVCFLSSNKMLLFCVILRQDLVSFFIRTRGARQRGGGAYRAPSLGGGRGNRH